MVSWLSGEPPATLEQHYFNYSMAAVFDHTLVELTQSEFVSLLTPPNLVLRPQVTVKEPDVITLLDSLQEAPGGRQHDFVGDRTMITGLQSTSLSGLQEGSGNLSGFGFEAATSQRHHERLRPTTHAEWADEILQEIDIDQMLDSLRATATHDLGLAGYQFPSR